MVLAISDRNRNLGRRSPNKTPKNPAGRAASTIASRAVSGGGRCQSRHVDPSAAIIRPTLLQSLEKDGDAILRTQLPALAQQSPKIIRPSVLFGEENVMRSRFYCDCLRCLQEWRRWVGQMVSPSRSVSWLSNAKRAISSLRRHCHTEQVEAVFDRGEARLRLWNRSAWLSPGRQ
jgi:hypothetical protein